MSPSGFLSPILRSLVVGPIDTNQPVVKIDFSICYFISTAWLRVFFFSLSSFVSLLIISMFLPLRFWDWMCCVRAVPVQVNIMLICKSKRYSTGLGKIFSSQLFMLLPSSSHEVWIKWKAHRKSNEKNKLECVCVGAASHFDSLLTFQFSHKKFYL